MGLKFYQLKKLWLLYLFLLFFAFFMFAFSINLYLSSLFRIDQDLRLPRRRSLWPVKNVVAHYIGKGDVYGNLSAEEYDIKLFKPIEGEGDEGRPVAIPSRDSLRLQRFFKLNSFNILASDRIALNRTLKDYRSTECRNRKHPTDLPHASVIIVFHNEAWSVLLRTITSVINRTPRQLLKEIILVDDASDRSYLKKPLESYIKVLTVPTRLIRMAERGGLVPARLKGAEHAKGEVLTFLDAHCECSRGWLEPLLARIKESRSAVICPVIDIISDDNFSYTKTFDNHWGAFNWQLSFRWFSTARKHVKRNDITMPIMTPAMAGGLFAIDRKYFFEVGSYDRQMKIWGGENVEMSFRIWQCGGTIEISPCSHVGHIFRKTTPYSFPGGVQEVLGNNLARAALVWMDDWQNFIMLYTSGLTMGTKETIDVSERLALREQLKCKPFSWYLENIWPEHFFPTADRFFGKIIWLDGESECSQAYTTYMKNMPGRSLTREWPRIFETIDQNAEQFITLYDVERDKCLRPTKDDAPSTVMQPVTVGDCTPHKSSMDVYVITPKGQIMTNDNICLTNVQQKTGFLTTLKNRVTSTTTSNVQLSPCNDDSKQLWHYDMDTQHMTNQVTGFCLTLKAAKSSRTGKMEKVVVALECAYGDITQKWGFVPMPWKL